MNWDNLILIFITLTTFSCSVKTGSDTGHKSFSNLKSYSWYQPLVNSNETGKFHRAGKGERIVELNINKPFVETQLTKKGYNITSDKPDFILRLKAFYEKEDNSSNLDWTRPGNNSRSNAGWGGNLQNSSGLKMVPEKTTIVLVEILDPVSEEVIWRGAKSRVVGEALDLTKFLEKDIQLILSKLPSAKK